MTKIYISQQAQVRVLLEKTHNLSRRISLTGFTLLEIMIALVVFTMGMTAVILAFNSGIFALSGIENVDLALNIAQAKMEELKNTAFGSLANSSFTPDAKFPRFSTAVNVAAGQNPMQVDVAVVWEVKGGQANISLSTLIANYSSQ